MIVDYNDGLRHGAAFGAIVGGTALLLIPIAADFARGISRRLQPRRRHEQHEIGRAVIAALGKVSTQLEDISEAGKALVERSGSLIQKKTEKKAQRSSQKHKKHIHHVNGEVRG